MFAITNNIELLIDIRTISNSILIASNNFTPLLKLNISEISDASKRITDPTKKKGKK